MDKSCNTAIVEGMYVNWTFHRLDAKEPPEARQHREPHFAGTTLLRVWAGRCERDGG